MRKYCLFFLIVVFCMGFSAAWADVPMLFQNIPLQLPNPDIQLNLSVSDYTLTVQTNWNPVYSHSYIEISTRNEKGIRLQSSDQLTYSGTSEKKHAAGEVQKITFISEDGGSPLMKSFTLTPGGSLLGSESSDGLRLFQYTNEDTPSFQYIQNDESDPELPIPAYSVKYDADGNVLSYTRKSGQNREITYSPNGSIDKVEALIAFEDGVGYHRIEWDQDRQCWFDPQDADAEFDLEPFIPDPEPSGETPDPENPPDETGGGENPAPGSSESSGKQKTPYVVSPPALTIHDLDLSYDPVSLHHVPLGELKGLQGKMVLSDQGYESVTIVLDETINMDKSGSQWTCTWPEGDYKLILRDHSGVVTCYSKDGSHVSMSAADPALQLREDGSYRYDGTGRENVMASYGTDGQLASYSYHNEDASKAVTYTPYGDVLYYSALSGDGFRYRYLNGVWQKQETSGGWTACDKPSDVNPSDLPPLLLLKRQTVPEGTWYPNNTAGVIGVSLRDKYPGLTRKWYHVLPVDLTIQGTQTFKMVASNLFYIGRVWVTVEDDHVTVRCGYSDGLVFPKEDMFRWFLSIDEVTHDFLEHPSDSLVYGKAYSISEDLGGAKTALLFVCNRVTYRQPIWNDGTMLVRYWPNIESVKAHRKKAEEMLDALPSAR